MKMFLFLTILLVLSGCSHKTLVKNCDQTKNGDYFVCETVLFK